ncbi:MAG: hypothetical protein PVF69_14715, partial [Gemmatimonadota bacterium]
MAALAVAALAAAPIQAQTHVSFGIGTGSLFTGVGFGFGSRYSTGSLFVGMSFGDYVGPYGIYSATYDGWGYGYRGTRHYHYSSGYCGASYYWDSYWDPYYGCGVYQPTYHYNSFRSRAWRYGWGRYYYAPTRYVYVSDPFSAPWGPYWAYDPWDSYWDGYWDGRRWGLWDGYYRGRTRVVYAGSGRLGSTIYRPSPFSRYGPDYKESPGRTATSRTATRRPGGA